MPFTRLHIGLLATLVAVLVAAPNALAATTTVRASDDAWVTDRFPTRNYGSEAAMRVHANPLKRAFVRFAVPTLSGSVQKAVLRVYAQTGASGGLRVNATGTGWTQSTITHANAPAAGALVATVPAFTGAGWREIEVTSAVTGAGARAFLVTAPSASSDVYLTSIEGGRAPELVITTSDTTPPPATPPANTTPPTIGGTAQVGQTLTATAGTWSGTTPISHAYQWLRCDTAGASCATVTGATTAMYALVAADQGRTMRVRVTATNSAGSASAQSAQTPLVQPAPTTPPPGTTITTDRPWNCTGALTAYGPLPIRVVSTIANASANDNDNAINLRGCYGDGNPNTIDLILDVRGNGTTIGTSYDTVRIGQNARDLVVTGNAECGARSTNSSIHQDIVQALSGERITFVDFTSGDPYTGRWTCWGAGGGWYITWANAGRPTDLICLRCKLATYNQNLRIGDSLRSGARDSVFGYSRSYGIFVESVATDPVNVNNQVIRY